MTRQAWTPADDKTLRRLCARRVDRVEIARRMGRTVFSIQSRARNLGLLDPPRYWTATEEAILRDRYSDTDTVALAAQMGRSVRALHGHAKLLGIKKSAAYHRAMAQRINAAGRTGTRFFAGQTPWNKGKKGWQAPGVEKSQFKPGHLPHTWRPIGTEEVRHDGQLYRKIRDDGPVHLRCKRVAILVWEAAHGPVPPGHVVAFRDRADPTRNITLDRLECISRLELMRRNTVHRFPPDLRAALAMKGRLTRVIREKTQTLEQTR